MYILRKEWEHLTGKKKEEFIQKIVKYYRENGFPHFEYTLDEQKKELERIEKYSISNSLIEDKKIKQTMHGVGVCWYYHPHHWDIRCGKSPTPMEVFKDDNLLRKAIMKRMKSGTHINNAMMRKTFKVSGGAQTVSNFRPTAARAIYDKYCPEGASVYDPSMGFGGRLMGAVSSPKVEYYTGCEPSDKTYVGLSKMGMDLILGYRSNFNYHFIHKGSEDYKPQRKFDMVFTSPPYFNTEKYSEEPTQSYIKFPTYAGWLVGFLYKTIENSLNSLKKGGYFIMNIAKVKTAPTLELDFQNYMKKQDISYVETLQLSLSKQHSGGKYKYEPVFVYRK